MMSIYVHTYMMMCIHMMSIYVHTYLMMCIFIHMMSIYVHTYMMMSIYVHTYTCLCALARKCAHRRVCSRWCCVRRRRPYYTKTKLLT